VSTTTSGTVTILFTDLVDSTEVISRAGDEQARAILRTHRESLQEAARAHGGRDVKWTGDCLMVTGWIRRAKTLSASLSD
jgi:class 3 adenylate cyclase